MSEKPTTDQTGILDAAPSSPVRNACRSVCRVRPSPRSSGHFRLSQGCLRIDTGLTLLFRKLNLTRFGGPCFQTDTCSATSLSSRQETRVSAV